MPSLEAEKAARAFGSTARISAVPKSHRKPFYARKNSLGCAYSVTVCVLVSTTIVINHLIFGFSQLAGADMIEGGNKASTNPDYWDPDAGLFKAVFDVGLTFNATSQDAVELQAFAYSQLCQHTPCYPEIDCELQSDQMSVCVVLKCKQFQMSKQAVQMSYMYSIWELWEMKTIEPLPGQPPESISTANVTKEYGKPGAVVLFGFSFVWPHVKLALLHLFFYLPMTSRGRRNGNYWLAVFGKWFFTDVLVMSALVGVFHLTLDTTASEVWDSAGPDLIETCGGTCETFMHEKTHPFEGIGQAIEAKLPPLQKFNEWNREQQDKMDAAWDEFVTKQKEKMDSAWDSVFHHGQAPSADFSCSCAWTANFACPDAPMPGNKGYAQKDNSACYAYCCPEDGAASQPSTGLASRIPKVTTAWDNFVDSMKAEMAKDPADRMGHAACAGGCANLGKVIGEALDAVHPDLVSTLHAGVQMEGMVAMYSFCIAVMLSLIVSIVVERLEGRGEGVVDHHAEGWDGYDSGEEESDDDDAFDEDAAGFGGRGVPTPPPSPPAEGAGGEAEGGEAAAGVRQVAPLGHVSVEVDTPGDEAGSSSAAPAAALDAGTATRTPIPETPSGLRRRFAGSVHFLEEKTKTAVGIFSPAKDTRTPREIRIERKIKRQMTVLGGAKPFPVTREWAWHSTICLLTSALLAYGMFTPCFTREVTGSVPALLKDTGFDFDEEYSIWSLSGIIYELGGFNRALMYTTYLVFCVIGPAVRCSTQLMLLLLPLPTKVLRMLHELSRNASIFYALEVLLVAVPLLNVTFGPVSKNLLTVENSPGLCGPLGERYGQETCLMLDVRLAKGYWIICAHVALFFYSGFDGSPTHKYCQHELHRSDCPPFPCCSKQQQDSPPSARSARQPTMH